MARTPTSKPRGLKSADLVALGAKKLASIITAQAKLDPVFARSVRMAVAAQDDPSALAHEIDKRLKTIRRSKSFLDWDKVGPLVRELEQLRQTIAGPLADQSPALAIEQMRQLLSLGPSVYERSDDSSGKLGDVFRRGGEDLGALWVRAGNRQPEELAAEVISLIEADGYGIFDELPDAASPALGSEGRAVMRRMVLERQEALSGGARRRFDNSVRWLLPKLADLDDDVDAFIAAVAPGRDNAIRNAQVAERLIVHGRAEEALEWIDASPGQTHSERELAGLRLAALENLGRKDDAQAERRRIFERWLDADMLRVWLKALPDFEDFGAEQAALDLVLQHEDATLALHFLINWPDMKRADRLVRAGYDRLDPRAYEILRPSAQALENHDPAAASLLYRLLVAGVLDRAISKYYPYAARDFHAAAGLADAIATDASLLSHAEWIEELRRFHGRKVGFWSLIDENKPRR